LDDGLDAMSLAHDSIIPNSIKEHKQVLKEWMKSSIPNQNIHGKHDHHDTDSSLLKEQI
jgi:uncharacterized protein YeaO (DUF488 family)